MIKSIAHVCLLATDLSAAERFYCRVLGLRKIFDFIREDRVIGFYLEVAAGTYIEIFQVEEIVVQEKAPILHICLEVDDIDSIRAVLIDNGCEVTEKILGSDQSWQAWTTDPHGVKIEFHQYTDRSSQITHENCEFK